MRDKKSRPVAFDIKSFYGPPPPRTTISGDSRYGDKPGNVEILNILEGYLIIDMNEAEM